ncbi:ABC transporter ATP-binding protein [Rhizobium oryzicola]|uniref:ATP-binding cassette domain-containing protein n=1 Tax=Rhizobium oryzicola TaxID=1232668 RepID=A0ABT8SR82_9HYPH|nr:ATP-binding cassette domain-containing protein [Rhizobium oryzicola]MDO1580548.1 ATP-binding cassette domain-containing protein [Rhizobium oryzicola]
MTSLIVEGVRLSVPDMAVPVLNVDHLMIGSGAHVAITGGSGSGKSSLLNVLSGLERPTAGRVVWEAVDIAALSESGRDRWRAEHVGLVMQDFHLFPGLSALENVLLPAKLARVASEALKQRAGELLVKVGLSRPDQHVETMSRGEMQRVAIARALLREPGIIVADEPTASLDAESGEAVANLLLSIAVETGCTLLVASHDPRLVERMKRRIAMRAGEIVSDTVDAESSA